MALKLTIAQGHQESDEGRLSHAADHRVARSCQRQQPHFLAGERQPRYRASWSAPGRCRTPAASETCPSAERPSRRMATPMMVETVMLSLAGNAQFVQREADALDHEGAVQAQAQAHRRPCRAAPTAGSPTAILLSRSRKGCHTASIKRARRGGPAVGLGRPKWSPTSSPAMSSATHDEGQLPAETGRR